MKNTCPTCRKTVPAGLFGIRLECSHWVHTKCLDKQNPDFEKCSACKGEVDLSVPLVDVNEPTSFEGRDYVMNPPKVSDSLFTRLLSRKPAEPWIWLKEHKAIDWMIQEKGHHLQKMIASGVTMSDFCNNGYTWQELKTFRDLNEPNRGREALFALQTNAEHFRDSLGSEPIRELQITGRHLVELYGLHFPSDEGPIAVVGGRNDRPWKASELVELGMKMTDLMGAGLEHLHQYVHLEPTDADEVKMEVTDADVAGLVKKSFPSAPGTGIETGVSIPVPAPVNYVKPTITKCHGLKPGRK